MSPAFSYAEVLAYLSSATGGLIGGAPTVQAEPAQAERLTWTRPAGNPAHFVPTSPRSPAPDQDAFTFDVDGFVAREKATDFVDAKRRFYARLPWDPQDQAHRLPYATPTAWTTLNHPPIKVLDGPLTRWTHHFEREGAGSPLFDQDFQRGLDAGGSELTHGNDVHLLANDASFREKLRLIAAAKDHLYIAVMFWACDATADQLTAALGERVRAGVDVRLMTEGVYRETITRRCVDRLEAAGVKVLVNRDALRPRTFGSVLHWKVWIRDGEELILGGQNVGDYESRSDGFNLLVRDDDVLATGPVVADAEAGWIAAWRSRGGEPGLERASTALEARKAEERRAGLRGREHYGEWLADPAARMVGNCRVLMQGLSPTGTLTQPIAPVVEALVGASRAQVVFSSPTVRYDPDDPVNRKGRGLAIDRLMRALLAPSDRELIVLTNGVGGGMGESQTWLHARRDGAARRRQWMLYDVARQFSELAARRAAIANRAVTLKLDALPNAEVWTYFEYIHTKIWLFDGLASLVGSWNLETNSTDKNPEAAIVCLDARLRDEVERDLTLGLVNAVPE